MASLLPAYQAGHLLVVHATGSTDPTRSHFDAQHYMEVGAPGASARHRLARPAPGQPSAHETRRRTARGWHFLRHADTLAGAPETLPIPDPSNFGLSGSSSTRTARLNWLANAYASEPDPLKSAALKTQRTISTLTD